VQGPDGPVNYAPANEDGTDYGDITVTKAMDDSVNAVFAQMAQDVGTSNVINTAHDLGMPDSVAIPKTPAMALGAFNSPSASPLDMAQVYATLANHGEEIPYSMVVKVTKDGTDLGLPSRDPQQAVPRTAVDTTTSVLQTVVDSSNGTASVAQDSGWPSAAKTGTAEDDKAAWFAGYTPKLATVIAVLGMDPTTGAQESLYNAMGMDRVNGGGPPGQVWAQYTKDALSGVAKQDFDLQLQSGAKPSITTPPPATTEPPGTTEPPQTTTPPPATSEPPTTAPPTDTTEPPTTAPTTGPTGPAPTDTTLAPVGGITGGPVQGGASPSG